MKDRRRRPNIVYIMADDLGFGDLGCYNPDSKIPTPNIDRMASEGLRFTDCHSPSAVCTPTRYSVLTGRYCWRSNLRAGVLVAYEPPLIRQDRLTLASMLKQHGYRTAAVGKWHLGLNFTAKPNQYIDAERPVPWEWPPSRALQEKIDFTGPVTGGPLELGFDYFFGTTASSTMQPPFGYIENDRFIDPPSVWFEWPGGVDIPGETKPGFMSPSWDHSQVDVEFTRRATAWLEEAGRSDEPFFLYLCASAVHEPCTEAATPAFARGRSGAGPRGDLAWVFDWMVGEVVAALERTGQLDDTLLIVTSDNGALPGDRVLVDGKQVWRRWGHKSCGDWRGYKCHIWEGGHREPLVVRWPGAVPPNSICHDLIGLTDIFATVAEIVGHELPDNAAEDSISMLPLLRGEQPEQPLRESIVHHSANGAFAIREGRWKLVLDTLGSGGWPPPAGSPPQPGTPGQLYDLEDDPWEEENLWEVYPAEVERLTALLNRFKQAGRSVPNRQVG